MMITARASLPGLLALAACHASQPAEQSRERKAELIACAPAGAAFAPVCPVELAPGGLVTVRNPDGGFHRLRIAAGRGVVSADGATPAQVRVIDQATIEVAVGGDRYRLPATVGATR